MKLMQYIGTKFVGKEKVLLHNMKHPEDSRILDSNITHKERFLSHGNKCFLPLLWELNIGWRWNYNLSKNKIYPWLIILLLPNKYGIVFFTLLFLGLKNLSVKQILPKS